MLFVILIIIGLIGFDQLIKFWALEYLKQVDTIPVIDNVFHLTYVENRGAAFGLFQNNQMLHLYAARSNRQRDHRAALRIYKHGFVKFLCLLDKKRTEAVCIRWAGAALKPQHIVFLRMRQFGGKFLFSRGERAIRLHKIVAVFIQPRCNTAEQQPELC